MFFLFFNAHPYVVTNEKCNDRACALVSCDMTSCRDGNEAGLLHLTVEGPDCLCLAVVPLCLSLVMLKYSRETSMSSRQ